MKILTYKMGGIHIPTGKDLTKNKKIVIIEPDVGEEMVFPVVQYQPIICSPLVKVGEEVFVGQKLVSCDVYMSSPVHSSISGIVKAVEQRLTPDGKVLQAVVVENDGKNTKLKEPILWDKKPTTRKEIINIIKEAGIVGLGGAGFPTHVKLEPSVGENGIDTIIINGSECEPLLTTDYRIMLEKADMVIKGLEIILKLFPKAKGIIGIEADKLEAVEIFEKAIKNLENISISVLEPKYPQGGEKQLIYSCLQREVPTGKLPADIGALVFNVYTAHAIYEAVEKGIPLMERILTLTGDTVKEPGNYKVKIGMSYESLLEKSGGYKENTYKIISGGPMMGSALFDLNVPIIKTTSSILCFSKEKGQLPEQKNCIRCAKCVTHCPMGLMPLELNKFAINSNYDSFLKYNGKDCIDCGICSYVCPSKRYLSSSITNTKKEIASKK